MKLTGPARVWYVLMNVAFGAGYLAKIPTKKALSERGVAVMTKAERIWYRLMCIAFGTGYFVKIPAAKALREASVAGIAVQGEAVESSKKPSTALIAAAVIGGVTVIGAGIAGGYSLMSNHHQEIPEETSAPFWHQNGIYRYEVRYTQGIVRTADGQVMSLAAFGMEDVDDYTARRTICNEGQCLADNVAVDKETRRHPLLDDNGLKVKSTVRWTGTQWVTGGDGPHGGRLEEVDCEDRADSWESWAEFTPLLDGTLKGTYHQYVLTNECGLEGDHREVPAVMVRVGDAPDGIFN
ncbi:hypothetical protein MU0083_003386 [[Mycobacterium] kokjensenii]|uniref:Uncharacterized protein n=1 Tax=[Mycobacterium] kokjensenii TaxID=3064287 RepID=A0ABN9NGD1_9MYCO|nr:hypothetical protein [Mycolicibacter sp. MU0083]CAJ1504237.1 hypothetical protein MU0083_003386 [Mycolicibacter sp. MU0083]